jgi:tetratricopeptide (TPR) repeat protein
MTHSPANNVAQGQASLQPASAPPILARRLETLALGLILAVAVARPYMTEMHFRLSEMSFASAKADDYKPPSELIRVLCAMGLLLAFTLWAASWAMAGRKIRGRSFLLLALALAGWSAAGLALPPDRRGAIDLWFEQFCLMLTCLAVMNMARDRRKFGLIVVVLVALAGAMGTKGIMQASYENSEQAAEFKADRARFLAPADIEPGSTQARLLERRVSDPSATGFMGLSNDFASLLVILGACGAGLAVEKVRWARQSPRLDPPRRGQVHLPGVAAVIAVLAAAAAAAALALTNSKGGAASGALAILAGGLAAWKGSAMLPHRRLWLAATGGAILAVIAGVAALGMAGGRLPGRSFQVRWEYWQGSVQIIRDAPLLGAGPGGFGDAYLLHRLPQAAESTRTPHNLIFDAATQYGLPGGLLYLAAIVWVLAAMTRPGRGEQPVWAKHRDALWLVPLTLAVILTRAVTAGTTGAAHFVIDAALPGAIFAAALAGAMWAGQNLGASAICGRWARIGLAAGVFGFVLHNLLTHSLWSPGTATIFWIAAGAAVAGGLGPLEQSVRAGRLAGALAGLATVGLVIALAAVLAPVALQRSYVRAATLAVGGQDYPLAATKLQQAADVDHLDALAPADLARLYWTGQVGENLNDCLASAARAAELAWRRSPTAGNARLLGQILFDQARPWELTCAWHNHRGDSPELQAKLLQQWERRKDPAVACQLAEVLAAQGKNDQALEVLDEAARQFGPAVPKLYEHLGDLAWRRGQPDQARQNWQLYIKGGEAADPALTQRAVELMLSARDKDPMDLQGRLSLGEMLWQTGRLAQAQSEIQEALRINALRPADSDIRYSPEDLQQIHLLGQKCRAVAAEPVARAIE